MMNEIKQMHWSIQEGGYVILQWPANISIESLDLAEEAINLQLKSVRRSISNRKESAAIQSTKPSTGTEES